MRLLNSELVDKIMRAKRSLNYYSTMDIDCSFLCSEAVAALSHTKILINEVSSSADYTRYAALKKAAKKASFKYVWHSAGNVLVRRGEKERVHTVRSVSDLKAALSSSEARVGLVKCSVDSCRQGPPPFAPPCSARGDGTD